MAGAGYKLFNTGDVLTAAQVNTYLQEQVVMVFANAAARTTALSGVLAEGMVSYLKDTDALEIYSGAAWVGYGSGDITGITTGATSGLTGGVTSGTADLKFNTTAKGGLLVGTGSGTVSELAVGSNAQVLTADSTTATGLKWAAAAGGGKVLQVVASTATALQSIKTASATDITGMSVSITPSAVSSKVLITGMMQGINSQNTTEQLVAIAIVDASNNTIVRIADQKASIQNGVRINIPFTFLHSPSSTSALTYKLRVLNDTSANGLYLNDWNNSAITSSIVAMEIGA